MQYVLTEKEYKALLNKNEALKEKYKTIINVLCKDVANHKPTYKTYENKKVPWGCIYNDNDDDDGYCDGCPVQDFCFRDKHYSK